MLELENFWGKIRHYIQQMLHNTPGGKKGALSEYQSDVTSELRSFEKQVRTRRKYFTGYVRFPFRTEAKSIPVNSLKENFLTNGQ